MLVITETWHENSDSSTPLGYQCIDAARPIAPHAAVQCSVDFQNHGVLAFVCRDAVSFQKGSLDISVTTFEYLYGFAMTGDEHFILLGVYTGQAVKRCLRRSKTSSPL